MNTGRNALLTSKTVFFSMLLVAIVGTVSLMPVVSRASTTSVTVTIVNNSNWDIRHLYLSPVNTDNWGDDQLNQSSIAPGTSRTLTLSWDQSTVKLIGEDQDGCFLSKTVDASGTQTWTIAGTESRNCGSSSER